MADDIKYTPEQTEAMENRGGSLLVAAAAGSGKTRVLVERLLRRVTAPEAGCDVDDFLVITYTKAAAAELRAKIRDGIASRLAEDPGNRRLRRQSSLCYRAHIGTIHSFCSEIIRENAHLLYISPDFRVADDSECAIIKKQALDRVLERKYDDIGQNGGFVQLADTLGAGRDDSRLVSVVIDLYEKLQSHPYPEKWANEQIEYLTNIKNITDVSNTPWGRVIMSGASSTAEYWLGEMRYIQEKADGQDDFQKAYGESISYTCKSLEDFIEAAGNGWDQAQEKAGLIAFPRTRPLKSKDFEDLKELRNKCKKAVGDMAALFDGTSAELLEDMEAVAPEMTELLRLVVDFGREYAAEKRRRSVLDFSDQEHMAVSLLVNEQTGQPTALAGELSERFREIMVDEYQDVNAVQEMIFRTISKNGANVFMVGDVKQSIYRFRLADPTIFLKKYGSFPDASRAGEGQGRKVILAKNFRSRAGILEAVNYVFSNIMSTEFGEMEYSEQEYLRAGAAFPNTGEPEVELHVLDMKGFDALPDGETPDKSAAEAGFVADRINALVGVMDVAGRDGTRKLRYGDVAVLMRAVGRKGEIYADILRKSGIPVASASEENFFDAPEISDMMAVLDVIDNPLQDIPLIAAMKSPAFGFTEDELAVIRLADRGGAFYDAVKASAADGGKAAAFLGRINDFRAQAPELTAGELIWQIYEELGILGIYGAMPGGESRRGKLMTLLEYAQRFESAGYKGLFGFVTYMRRLAELGKTPESGGEAAEEDSVHIMSIHKSKGLEFPVVFICDMAKRFNREDFKRPILVHSELGIGAKRIDLIRKTAYPTVARRAIALVMSDEMMAEELRVLYVAMTRAKEKLIMTCAFRDAKKELESLAGGLKLPVPPQVLKTTQRMADWVLLPALARPECGALRGNAENTCAPGEGRWTADVTDISERDSGTAKAETQEAEKRLSPSPELEKEIGRRLSYVYPHMSAVSIPSKLTATQIKGRVLDLEAEEEAAQPGGRAFEPGFRAPLFAKEKRLTAAEKGTALHLALQYAKLESCVTGGGMKDELDRLEKLGILTPKQRRSIPAEKIASMLASGTGEIILSADKVMREFKFSILTPASDYYSAETDDEILLQGVVDCCAEKDGVLTIIDYKTDNVDSAGAEERAESYRDQINAYAGAMQRITGKAVKSKILYFFSPEKAIIIK